MVYIKVLCGIGNFSGDPFIRFQPTVPCLLLLIIMIRDLGAAVNNGGNSKLLPTCIMTTLTKRHPPTVT